MRNLKSAHMVCSQTDRLSSKRRETRDNSPSSTEVDGQLSYRFLSPIFIGEKMDGKNTLKNRKKSGINARVLKFGM